MAGVFERLFGAAGDARFGVAPAPREARSVAIASGKGGTGKSFLATSLAVLLSRRGRRTTLVDCDFGLACDHLLLGVTPAHTLQHGIDGRVAIERLRERTRFGPDLVAGGSGVQRMTNLGARELGVFADGLGHWASDSDVLVLDVGAGIAPQSVLTMLAVDHVLLVTQPEIAALTDAYAVVKCLARHDGHPSISVVVNRISAPGQGEPTFEKLARVAEQFTRVSLHYLGEIRDEPAVTQRRLGQEPLVVSHPECSTAQEIRGIIDRLESVAGPLKRREVAVDQTLTRRFQRLLRAME